MIILQYPFNNVYTVLRNNCFLAIEIFIFTAARTPFSIRFLSDHYDYAGEPATAGDIPNGFCLIYQQYSCT